MMDSFNICILVFVFQTFSKCLATFEFNNNKNEEDRSASLLVRVSQLEFESQLHKEKMVNLEKKVKKHENVMKNLEEKFKHQQKLETYEFQRNEFNYSSDIIEEPLIVPSSTSRVNESILSNSLYRGIRPARLFPSYMFNKPKDNDNGVKHPTNCKDLNDIGYTLNGFYLVEDKLAANNSTKLQTVFCNFKNSITSSTIPHVKETLIGYLDIKTIREGVYFYVHKSCSASNENGIVRFDLVDLNLGRGYSSSTGVFTCPKSGVYQFSFNALKEETNPNVQSPVLVIFLRVNGIQKGVAFSVGGSTPSPVSLHSTLKLNKGDRVDLFKTMGKINCNDKELSSHFIGSLLEEDLNVLQITTAFCKKKMFKCSSTLIGLESPAVTRLNRGLGSPLGNFSYNLWYKYQ